MNKKKKKCFIVISAILIAVISGVIILGNPSRWSELEFEGFVTEIVIQSDGETRLIVERTTNIYGNPINSLGITENTKLLDANGNDITITEIKEGTVVKVSMKDAFTEETPFYYPTVYEIRIVEK